METNCQSCGHGKVCKNVRPATIVECPDYIGKEVLEKQNPKQPDFDEYGDPYCPRCGRPVTFDLETDAYEEWCSGCGQHLEVGK